MAEYPAMYALSLIAGIPGRRPAGVQRKKKLKFVRQLSGSVFLSTTVCRLKDVARKDVVQPSKIGPFQSKSTGEELADVQTDKLSCRWAFLIFVVGCAAVLIVSVIYLPTAKTDNDERRDGTDISPFRLLSARLEKELQIPLSLFGLDVDYDDVVFAVVDVDGKAERKAVEQVLTISQ